MQKVYLLLRNNQQNGPYNLEELLQFNLKPIDLIWIEGRSAGWYYPQEIEALRPHLPFVKQAVVAPQEAAIPVPPPLTPAPPSSPKKIFVSMPLNSREGPPAKPLADKAFQQPAAATYATASIFSETKEPETIKTSYTKTLEEVETDYTNWVYQKKTKKPTAVSKKGIVAACLLVTVSAAAWWLLKPSDIAKPEQVAVTASNKNALPDSSSAPLISRAPADVSSTKKAGQTKTGLSIKGKGTVVKSVPGKRFESAVLHNNAGTTNEYEGAALPAEEKKIITQEKKVTEPVTNEPKEQKKKLKEKLLDLFKKKKDDPVTTEAKPAEDDNGERRAARREAADLITQVTVKFDVPNDWMMGIKAAKASFVNHNDETIARAVVQVIYYNEDNDIVDKRTIYFSNIGAKKTQTLSIPDHAVADHLDYKIISVQGSGEPVAGF